MEKYQPEKKHYPNLKNMKIKITKEEQNQRLDIFLSNKFSVSRSQVQKKIKQGEVLVNGKNKTPHYLTADGDILETKKITKQETKVSPNKNIILNIIKETNDYLVLEKPSGIAVHPAEGLNEPTLVDGICARYPKIAQIGEDKLRPGIVHRLDKDVSGVIVVAKTQKMFDSLKNQFKKRSVTKEYIALAHGAIEEEEIEITTPIGRSKTKPGKMAAHTTKEKGDKDAKTFVKVLERFRNLTLLSIKISTGRTHQIRVHLNSIENPIAGDTLYTNRRIKKANLKRPFLHASKIEFEDLDGQKKCFESELPKELKNFLIEKRK